MLQALSQHDDHSSDKPRILIADADADTRSVYSETLRLAGWDVLEACDGREALTMALVSVPRLVLTELRLPFIDGHALSEILRRDRSTADVPILTVTGESRESELDRARRAGVDSVLIKPTTPEALLHEIRRLLDQSTEDARRETPRVPSSESSMPSQRRLASARTHARCTTTTPPASPPTLTCPSCDGPLAYVESHIGGVSDRHAEQWDDFECKKCGGFQYRQRTRKLRRT